MNSDTQRIEYAALEDEHRRLYEQKYGNAIFLEQIKDDIKRLNEKVDDIMLVLENITNDTPTYKEAASLWQFV